MYNDYEYTWTQINKNMHFFRLPLPINKNVINYVYRDVYGEFQQNFPENRGELAATTSLEDQTQFQKTRDPLRLQNDQLLGLQYDGYTGPHGEDAKQTFTASHSNNRYGFT